MKITRKNIVSIYNVLSEFTGTYNKLFSMYLVLNIKKIKSHIDDIQEIQKSLQPSEEYLKLQQKEIDIVNKYVEKDENNKPITLGPNRFQIKKDSIEIYNKEKNELLEENSSIIKEYQQIIDNVNLLMNEEVDVDVIEIPFDCIPEEIGVDKLEVLSDIIKDFGKI